MIEIRSPLPGKIERILAPSGSRIASGAALLTINSDEESVWEALRGLSLIGKPEDLPAVERLAQDAANAERIRKQAALTANAIKSRVNSQAQIVNQH
jgi:pyruvate/2-oxoglutarate dehydrogenase complex dihydrolipoamide acyltransferase (E2) component